LTPAYHPAQLQAAPIGAGAFIGKSAANTGVAMSAAPSAATIFVFMEAS